MNISRPYTAEQMARIFHDVYERLAPEYGYKTREESAKPWNEIPESNRQLMIATVTEVLRILSESEPPVMPWDRDPIH